MTSALEPAILTSVAPASAAGMFSRVNAGSRSSGSFVALCAAQLATQPAHASTPVVPTTLPTAGVNGSQKLPGKAIAAALLSRDPQENTATAPTLVLPPILPMPVPAPAILNAALPEAAAEVFSPPAANGNAENTAANRSSQATAQAMGSRSLSAQQMAELGNTAPLSPVPLSNDQPGASVASVPAHVAASVP